MFPFSKSLFNVALVVIPKNIELGCLNIVVVKVDFINWIIMAT